MNFRKLLSCFTIIFWISINADAQMINGIDTLYGNEWINQSQSYFKIKVAQNGMYRLDYNDLDNAGVFSASTIPQGQNFQLIKNGKSIPLFVSETNTLIAGDFITFYGEKNKGEIDKYLYDSPSYQANSEYSLFTDTSIYYLTWDVNIINPDIITTVANDLTNLPAKEIWCYFEKEFEWHTTLNLGIERGGTGNVSAKYDIAEGYTKGTYSTNQALNVSLSNKQSTGVPNAVFEVQAMAEDGNHQMEILINNITYINDTFSNWAVKNHQIDVPMNATANNTQVRVRGNASSDDKYRLAFIKAKYPRQFKFSNTTLALFEMDSSWQKQYFEIQIFNHGGTPPILYDLTNGNRITTQISGSKILVVVPPSSTYRNFVLVSQNVYKTTTIENVQFSNITPTQGGDYIILTHSKLFDDGTGVNYIQDYANYRASTLGGSYTPVIVDIDQVYEQFGYGIDRQEQAIRNFVQWSAKHWNSKFLFIIGKGVYYGKYRNGNAAFEDYELVPSFGFPTSDNLLAAKPDNDVPILAVGRIAAYTPDMVRIYLDKIKEMELSYQTAPQTIEDRAWQKNFLHLGGGTSDIQDFIKNGLKSIEDTIVNSQLGANVLGYYKNSTDVIQNANSDDVTQRINEGLAWITFFGHSAPNTLDFDIGDPIQYQNQGKYPMIYAMGCNTNRLLETSSTLSESYVFVENRGAIGFIGSTATTGLGNLNRYGELLYQNLGDDNYGETIGEILQATVADYPATDFWSTLVKHNIFLHGDPAVKIYPQSGIDYIIDIEKTNIQPSFVNIQNDSFLLDLVVANIGSTVEDSMNILIEQEYPDGTMVGLKTIRVKSPKFEEHYLVWLPLENKEIVGNNTLHFTLDIDNDIAEAPTTAEANNTGSLTFSIISNSAKPVAPYEYSIVTEPTITLKASTSNILTDNIRYYFEIDTTKNFNSPLNQGVEKQSTGGLITWQPSITLQDSTVYYWRVSMDSSLTNGNGFDWQNSSFVYIPQSLKGWNQSHYYQQAESNSDLIIETQQSFLDKSKEVKIINGTVQTGFNADAISIYFDGFKVASGFPCPQGWLEVVHIAVLEKNTLDWKTSENNSVVGVNCWVPDMYYMIKETDNINDREDIVNFLQDSIQDGEMVMFFTMKRNTHSLSVNQWANDSLTLGTNIFQVLENEGASQIRNMATNETSYIMIYEKGNPNWAGFREVHGANTAEVIQATTVLTGKQTEGAITTLPIGPAKSWSDIKWQVSDYNTVEDTISLDVIGITADAQEVVLATGLSAYDISLDFIDVNIYPYLKLRYNVKDEVELTPAQLDYWRVFYEPYPDAALNPDAHLVFHADTIQQGDQFQFEIGVENVTSTDMDSLLVKYTVTNAANQGTQVFVRNEALLGDSTLRPNLYLDTRNMLGNHLINIEINPNDDQVEQYHFNNSGVKRFYVKSDETAPILDVTFDGLHIMNGDIISSKPNILIALEDENPFIALDDTSTFELYIRYPSGTTKRFYVDNQTVIFRPADNTDLEKENKAEIEFLPEFLEDGVYQLQVKAKDITDNQSGANQYKIDFEVITKSMVSNVLNYPNPFTTATQFVFTLTGSEIPEAMSIQIMTVSGKLVKTITKAELGDIHIGLNRTEYVWDGTDDFGNPLANGVYLYRVSLKSATDEVYEKFNTGTNDYFKNGFGKMVILR